MKWLKHAIMDDILAISPGKISGLIHTLRYNFRPFLAVLVLSKYKMSLLCLGS